MAATAVICGHGNTAVTNYVTPSSTISGSAIAHTSYYPYTKMSDDSYTSYFLSGVNSVGQTLQVDLGGNRSINSFSMLQVFSPTPSNKSKYDVYIGDTAYTDEAYKTANKKCMTNVMMMGIANCSGSGQYLIWEFVGPSTTAGDI